MIVTKAQSQEQNKETTGLNGMKLALHAEGLALLVAAVVAYYLMGGRWWLFALLLFVPDVFMLGYLVDKRVGALVYNAGHTVTVPLVLIGLSLVFGWTLGSAIGVIWLAHIGLDRTMGYGLKYATGFKDTHLQRV